jgi:dipeptidyl aminopeptidase/acylaminoacyl peptidase
MPVFRKIEFAANMGDQSMQRLALGVGLAAFLVVTSGRAQEQPPASEKKPLTPESFLDLRNIQDPHFSPDATRIAFVVSEPSKTDKPTKHIWSYDRRSSVTRQLTYSDKSETSPRWSPDGKTLAFLSNRGGDDQQIYLLRMDGGEAAALTKAKENVSAFAWSPDGQTIAFIAPEPKTEAEEKKEKDKNDAKVVDKDDKHEALKIVNLTSRAERSLTEPTWKVEELQWLPDGLSIVVIATNRPAVDQHTNRVYSIIIKDGKMEELVAPRGPFSNLRLTPDGKLLGFIGAPQDGPQPHDILIVPREGGAPRNLSGASLDRQILDYQFAKDASVVAVYADGFHNKFGRYIRDGERKDLEPLPVNPGQFDISPGGELAFTGETMTAMEELWLRDADGKAQQLTHFNDLWKGYGLVAPEFYTYKSFDGMEIGAAVLKPAGYDGKSKLPLVVLVHGGPTYRWDDSIEAWGQLLASKGYAVLYPNIRGSIGYGEKFVEMNRADWGGADFKDVMWGVSDLITKGIADPERLGIGGWSYGGYMAEWAVTQTTQFKAAVCGAGMSNLISEFGTEEGSAYDEWFWGVPYEKPEGFLNSSPFLYVKNAKTPILILQGEADTTDPMGQSLELYRGLKHYGVDAELVVFPRELHSFQEARHLVDMQNRVTQWFDKYLGKKEAK